MTSIDRIIAKNFRSFADIDISFKAKDGIILMSGDIGSGKSTLINAICWCLYGDTPLFAIGDPKRISNLHAPEGTPVEVELTVTIDNRQYVFSRRAIGVGIGGSLTVQYETNGNWETVDGAATNDFVRRLLPKDIRHLFVFNGEQIMKIFDPENHGNLKSSVLKVSEVDLINYAKEHLSSVSDEYFSEIKKLNKHAKEIESLRLAVDTYTREIDVKQKSIDKFEADIAIKKDKISALDKEIESTADARKLLDDKERIEKSLEKNDETIFDLEQERNENFTNYYVGALLDEEFEEYKKELEVADEQGLIPPPVKPEVTARILRDKKCICGRVIGPEEESYIQQQHEEYRKKEELHYLTDGINCFYRMHSVIKQAYYDIQDCMEKLDDANGEKKKLSRDLKIVNDALDGKQKPNGDNPEARRNDLRNEIELFAKAKGREENAKEDLARKLEEAKDSLKNAIMQDDTTELLQKKMDYSDKIISWLGQVASIMEEQIREKLKENTEEIFFSILSGEDEEDVKFSEIDIDNNYIVSLQTDDGAIYATENLSTGQAKSLGLSLVYSLSKDLGYSETPLLIDNLYGDISEKHYEELTTMIRKLSNDKQIIITDLMSSAARKLLGTDVVKQSFIIKGESKQSVIYEETL